MGGMTQSRTAADARSDRSGGPAGRPTVVVWTRFEEAAVMSTAVTTPGLDEARIEQFADRLLATYTDSVVALMIDLADRTGLFERARRRSGHQR